MAYWGVAWALGPRYAYVSLTPGSDIFLDVDLERERAAYQAVQQAMAMRSLAPENERRYIEALANRYSGNPNPNRRKLLSDYKDAMDSLVRQLSSAIIPYPVPTRKTQEFASSRIYPCNDVLRSLIVSW
jgi:hypothetical protein